MNSKEINYDNRPIKFDSIEYVNHYGREDPILHKLVLKLNSREQNILQKILDILNSNTDYKDIIGYANYKFMINCTITKLAELLDVNRTVLSKALKVLEKHKLIKHDNENKQLIYVNPFLFNTNRIFDAKSLTMFKDHWNSIAKNTERSWDNGKVIRKTMTEEQRISHEKWLNKQRALGKKVDF